MMNPVIHAYPKNFHHKWPSSSMKTSPIGPWISIEDSGTFFFNYVFSNSGTLIQRDLIWFPIEIRGWLFLIYYVLFCLQKLLKIPQRSRYLRIPIACTSLVQKQDTSVLALVWPSYPVLHPLTLYNVACKLRCVIRLLSSSNPSVPGYTYCTYHQNIRCLLRLVLHVQQKALERAAIYFVPLVPAIGWRQQGWKIACF